MADVLDRFTENVDSVFAQSKEAITYLTKDKRGYIFHLRKDQFDK